MTIRVEALRLCSWQAQLPGCSLWTAVLVIQLDSCPPPSNLCCSALHDGYFNKRRRSLDNREVHVQVTWKVRSPAVENYTFWLRVLNLSGTYYDSDGEGNDIDDSEESEEPSYVLHLRKSTPNVLTKYLYHRNWDHQVVDPKTGKWMCCLQIYLLIILKYSQGGLENEVQITILQKGLEAQALKL